MHELSLAEAVVEISLRHAAGRTVRKVELRVGYLRQVVPSALEFAFELLSSGTALEGAELVMEEVPARGRCRACAVETTMEAFPLQCSACGRFDLDVIAGEELLVDALELEETATVTSEGIRHGG
ncbi:MAG TPA: hydrogenase maturation nickel metallochaperone HypA [Solirubrobacteraceae bacterium]|nr:hydrogenase maturation nickel metallochaperone HypA [Solirubrobacteraceae bacterium]